MGSRVCKPSEVLAAVTGGGVILRGVFGCEGLTEQEQHKEAQKWILCEDHSTWRRFHGITLTVSLWLLPPRIHHCQRRNIQNVEEIRSATVCFPVGVLSFNRCLVYNTAVHTRRRILPLDPRSHESIHNMPGRTTPPNGARGPFIAPPPHQVDTISNQVNTFLSGITSYMNK